MRSEWIMKLIGPLLMQRQKKQRVLKDYIDVDEGLCGIGYIPNNIKKEISAVVRGRAGSEVLSEDYLREVGVSEDGLKQILPVIDNFLALSRSVIGDKKPKSGDPLFPWVQALYISPEISVNACVRISSDIKAATVYVIFNAGVFVQLTHRVSAMLADDGFLKSFGMQSSGAEAKLNPPKNGDWVNTLPLDPRKKEIARQVAFFGASIILSHELAHFYRGHLGYLRNKLGLSFGTYESFLNDLSDDVAAQDVIRLLELDADQAAGTFFSTIFREFDHPTPGPKDGHNERFLFYVMIAITSTYILFEDVAPSRKYYSPSWRIHHVFNGFINNFFSEPPNEEDKKELIDMLFKVIKEVEECYERLGWGNGFTYGTALPEAEQLINKDSLDLKELEAEFAEFMPHLWPKERKHNR
ncbi:MAG: hypothetical protein ACRERR_08355 [Moraxellaceae bacterium]